MWSLCGCNAPSRHPVTDTVSAVKACTLISHFLPSDPLHLSTQDAAMCLHVLSHTPLHALQVHLLFGVDVTGSKYLGRPEVMRAADFAAAAHAHQRRRTGEPYVTHCIATAKIVEGLIASSRTQVADER